MEPTVILLYGSLTGMALYLVLSTIAWLLKIKGKNPKKARKIRTW